MGYCLCVDYVLNNFMFTLSKFSKYISSLCTSRHNLGEISGFTYDKPLIIITLSPAKDVKKWTSSDERTQRMVTEWIIFTQNKCQAPDIQELDIYLYVLKKWIL